MKPLQMLTKAWFAGFEISYSSDNERVAGCDI